jgi:hypothetical protein
MRLDDTIKEEDVKRSKNISLAVAVLVAAMTLAGCATPQQQLQSNSKCLTVVVRSVPSGAKVYGVGSGGAMGSLLGNTPMEFRYTHLGGSNLAGTAPLEETMESAVNLPNYGSFSSRAVFKCFVVMDGYLPYRIYEEVDNTHHTSIFESQTIFNSFWGGRREFTANLQPAQPVVVLPSAGQQNTQQPAKEGKITISCDVEAADVFVDGAFVGNSPATLSLSEGTHTIEVKKQGQGAYKREVRVLAGSQTSIRAELHQ